jgi:hypothetical protein
MSQKRININEVYSNSKAAEVFFAEEIAELREKEKEDIVGDEIGGKVDSSDNPKRNED